jgi:DNA helicase-2/ATP-dependent DNA helicase PcrA
MTTFDGLNVQQRRAVEHTEGPLLVLAGAGSGKTRVIVHRILHLIESGILPQHILAVTFTNKAAGEMRERVGELLRNSNAASRASVDGAPTVATFHSLCVRLLREYHEAAGLRRNFTIYDRADSVRAMKRALVEAGYDPKQFEPRRMLGIISRAKGDALSRLDFSDRAASYPEQVAAEAWERYDAILREEHALDFDDLLVRALELLRTQPAILAACRDRFRYLHIDEYQDTNKAQYELARLLAGDRQNICAVGDVDQNVYSWRGASIANILQFEKHFAGAAIVMLEENYRSTQAIIAASNDIIEKNVHRPAKTVFTKNAEGEKLSLFVAENGADEAAYVALTAKELIRGGAAPSEIAVLFRTNFQSRALEEAFLDFDVPYQVLGTRFFERKEVKDVLSFLRLAVGAGGSGDIARVANVPPRGIGKVTLLKIIEGKRGSITGAAREKVAAFDALVMDLASAARTKPPSDAIKYLLARSGLEAALKKDGEEGLERLENLRELVTLAARYDELPGEEAFEKLFEDAALQSDQDELKKKEEQDAVRLMTIHAAKGLEFSYVFVTGLEAGLFPHERLSDEGIDEEEERRLFYVALTRAKRKVFLSFAQVRTIFGSQRLNIPSAFLSDIRGELIEPAGYGGADDADGETVVYLD